MVAQVKPTQRPGRCHLRTASTCRPSQHLRPATPPVGRRGTLNQHHHPRCPERWRSRRGFHPRAVRMHEPLPRRHRPSRCSTARCGSCPHVARATFRRCHKPLRVMTLAHHAPVPDQRQPPGSQPPVMSPPTCQPEPPGGAKEPPNTPKTGEKDMPRHHHVLRWTLLTQTTQRHGGVPGKCRHGHRPRRQYLRNAPLALSKRFATRPPD